MKTEDVTENNGNVEKVEQSEKDKEEGEILEESPELYDDDTEEETEAVDSGTLKTEETEQARRGERALRSTMPRLSKTKVKQTKDVLAPKEVLPSATGRTRATKKK